MLIISPTSDHQGSRSQIYIMQSSPRQMLIKINGTKTDLNPIKVENKKLIVAT